MKLTASADQPEGTSSGLTCTCLLSIWSLIYFLFLPLYGLRPSIN